MSYKRQIAAFLIGMFIAMTLIIVSLNIYNSFVADYVVEKFGASYRIKNMDNLQTEYYDITDRKINSFARGSYIIPYDKLMYHMTITSKVPYPTTLQYILEIKHGNESPEVKDEIILLKPYTTQGLPMEFSTNHTGYHDLKITLNLHNGTDYDLTTPVLNQEVPLSTKIDVLSLSDKLLAEQNLYVLIGVTFSAIIGSITLYALWKERESADKQIEQLKIQNKDFKEQSEKEIDQLKIQNGSYKEQSEKEIRPWLGLAADKQFELTNTSIDFHIKNYGSTPAIEMIATTLLKEEKIDEMDLLTNGKQDPPMDVIPSEQLVQAIEISKDVREKMKTHTFWIGMNISYKFENGKTGRTLVIGKLETGDPTDNFTVELRKVS